MKVERASDRMEMPEECDNCGGKVKLERYIESSVPIDGSYNVEWFCKYCANAYRDKERSLVKTMAAMFNILEEAIGSNRKLRRHE